MLNVGFDRSEVTPRVGVELCGFGAYLHRRSIGVRSRLWAKAAALEVDGHGAVLVSCDLIGISREMTDRVRELVSAATGLPEKAVIVHCTHTHSGPATVPALIGWGEPDQPYLELLPQRIARAAVGAWEARRPARMIHAEVPCEGIGLNREYDKDAPPLEEVLADGWRPARPELTDTTCHVVRFEAGDELLGWWAYFGCHPVVCCAETRYIHGDYCGVALNQLEQLHPGATGLFLQGAQGDVNSCVVHKPETEALLALDVVAGRFARAVAAGLRTGNELPVDSLATASVAPAFSRRQWDIPELRERLATEEAKLTAPDADETSREVRMGTVFAVALRKLLAGMAAGRDMQPPIELTGLRVGELALLTSPFEVFQAIKNDVVAGASGRPTLVMGITNGLLGYAPDRTAAARGGYAADTVPMMLGHFPFANLHDELAAAYLQLDAQLRA